MERNVLGMVRNILLTHDAIDMLLTLAAVMLFALGFGVAHFYMICDILLCVGVVACAWFLASLWKVQNEDKKIVREGMTKEQVDAFEKEFKP